MLTGGDVVKVLSVPRNATIGTVVSVVGSVMLTGGYVDEAFSVPRNATIGTGVLCLLVPLPSSVARGNTAGALPGAGASLSCPLGRLLLVLSDIGVGLPIFPGFWGSDKGKRGAFTVALTVGPMKKFLEEKVCNSLTHGQRQAL